MPQLQLLILAWFLPAAIVLQQQHGANALSSPSSSSRPFVELTNPLLSSGRPTERLPASFVHHWPTFVLHMDQDPDSTDIHVEWMRIPDDHNDGSSSFCNPHSLDELRQPLDLSLPELRLCLGLHVRQGMIRHVLPAMDATLLSGNNNNNKMEQHVVYRNRGLCSVPRAYQWMDFPALLAGGSMVRTTSNNNQNAGCRMDLQLQQPDNDDQWETVETLFDGDTSTTTNTDNVCSSMEDAINLVIQALAQDGVPDEVAQGSCLVHVLLDNNNNSNYPLVIPKPGGAIRARLFEDDTVVACLEVRVEATAAGSESDYLPNAYRPLFEDESVLRPAFLEVLQRRRQSKLQPQQQESAS